MSAPSPPIPWQAQLHAAWRSAEPNSSTTSFIAQLSTIRGPSNGRYAGRPAVRTVNIRRITSSSLFFITDTRSGKCHDIDHASSPHAELCCYFPQPSLQFRISGVLAFLPHSHPESQQFWASLYQTQREWWTWPRPGADRAPIDQFEQIEPSGTAPDNFCVGKLDADFVDVLDLSTVPFMREIHELSTSAPKVCDGPTVKREQENGGWQARRVNP